MGGLRILAGTGSQDAPALDALVRDCLRNPLSGIGKPEPLRENLSGYWSRRIDDTHRLVYRASDQDLIIIACRYHYA